MSLWAAQSDSSGTRVDSVVGFNGDGGISGYAIDRANLSKRCVVELLADGVPIGLQRAQGYVSQLAEHGVGDGCYGFEFRLSSFIRSSGSILTIALANTGEIVGTIQPDGPRPALRGLNCIGQVLWAGGLRLVGWTRQVGEQRPSIKALEDGQEIARAYANSWMAIGQGTETPVVPAFDLQLPQVLADGKLHRVEVLASDGSPLAGSPCSVLAFPDGLSEFLRSQADPSLEPPWIELLDRLLPQSLPFAAFPAWRRRYPLAKRRHRREPIAVVLVGDEDPTPSIESLKAQNDVPWIAGALEGRSGAGTFHIADLTEFLDTEASGCAILVFALAGTRFEPDALTTFQGVMESCTARLVYSDVAIECEQMNWPLHWTAFDYERLLEQGYAAYLFAMRQNEVRIALSRKPTNLFRLFNVQLERDEQDGDAPMHVPEVLGTIPRIAISRLGPVLCEATTDHLRARGVAAEALLSTGTLLPSTRVSRSFKSCFVSIVVPYFKYNENLTDHVFGVMSSMPGNDYELILAYSESVPPLKDALGKLDQDRVRMVQIGGACNSAKIMNEAAHAASGELLVFVSARVCSLSEGWLSEVKGRMADRSVGAAGGLVIRENGLIEDAGVVLGPAFATRSAFTNLALDDPGYADMLRVARSCGALRSTFFATRKSLYEDLGGMDEIRFPYLLYDVDFCLRLRAEGRTVLFTPHATALVTGGSDPELSTDVEAREVRNLRARWGTALVSDDFYNPCLSLDWEPFTALAWPPRERSARQPIRPVPTTVPPGF